MTKNYLLIKNLQTKFSQNSHLREKCIVTSKNKINTGYPNRAFDDFPDMLDESQVSTLLPKYKQLLKSSCRRNIRDFEKEIIKIACDELLDDTGNVSQELITTLEWDDCQNKIDNYLVISAFVGFTNMFLTQMAAYERLQNEHTYLAMNKIINSSYGSWIRDYMNHNKIKYDTKYDTDTIKVTDVLLYPIKHPLFSLSLFAGGLTGLGIYGGVKLAQELYRDNAPVTLPEAPRL